MAAPSNSHYRGWFLDRANSALDLYVGFGGASDPVELLQATTSALTLGDDLELQLGASGDAGLQWSTGDSSNHAAVLFVGQSNQVLHIAEADDKDLDWALSANAADPQLIIHSSTTPATDYLSFEHSGAIGIISSVGGGLDLRSAAGTEVTVNDSSADVDFRVESANVAKMIFVNAGDDTMSIGGSSVPFSFIQISPPANAGTPGSEGCLMRVDGFTFTDSATSGSATVALQVFVGLARPTLAATNSSVTTTDCATFYIINAPAAGSNQTLTRAYAMWVDNGASRFDGAISLGTDHGNDGQQLTSGGDDAACDWTADSCLRESKKGVTLWADPQDALDTLLSTRIYNFRYKGKWEDGVKHTGTGDYTTEYTGPMADEAPWAMHHSGTILNPINALGYTVLAFQAMQPEIEELRARVADLEAQVA